MRLDKDFLTELELWPHFEMRRMAARVEPAMVLPAPAARVARVASVVKTEKKATPAAAIAVQVTADPARALRIAGLDWQALATDAATCKACGLCQQRRQVVVGTGAQTAPWLFIGEGPGAEEDESGEPFVGQSGKLLDAMLKAVGLQRGTEVAITNVVKCRPPGNRTPTLDEAAACAPYLDRQIALQQPKLIVALGKTAITRLTGLDAPMASLRGQVHQYQGIPVVATFHPSYLLHKLPEKLKAWEDLLLAKSEMEKTLAGAA